MKRENRYIVIKRTDAIGLNMKDQMTLNKLCGKVAQMREQNGKGKLECVVVESDWPEYEPVWGMIEKRMDG